jgi:hypothetical protein
MAYRVELARLLNFDRTIFGYPNRSIHVFIFRARQVRWLANGNHYDWQIGADRRERKVGSWIPGQLAFY